MPVVVGAHTVASPSAVVPVVQSPGYQNGRGAPRPVGDQIAILKSHFPRLRTVGFAASMTQMMRITRMPTIAEGWFVVPAWHAVADSEIAALERMLCILFEVCGLSNLREGKITSRSFRSDERDCQKFGRIMTMQRGSNLFCFPAQLGSGRVGCGAAEVRSGLGESEFCLTPFSAAAMILTHPDRLVPGAPFVGCAGSQFDYEPSSGRFDHIMVFGATVLGRRFFSSGPVTLARPVDSVATGFVPDTSRS